MYLVFLSLTNNNPNLEICLYQNELDKIKTNKVKKGFI